jgi:hypothetical protein
LARWEAWGAGGGARGGGRSGGGAAQSEGPTLRAVGWGCVGGWVAAPACGARRARGSGGGPGTEWSAGTRASETRAGV